MAVTSAWVVSGGTDKGVMKLVGRTLREQYADTQRRAVCIGFASYGAVAHHKSLSKSGAGGAIDEAGKGVGDDRGDFSLPRALSERRSGESSGTSGGAYSA